MAIENWEPKAGEQADWIVDGEGNSGTFTVLHIERGWAMLWDGTDAYACEVSELARPLPPEPPELKPCPHCGRAAGWYPSSVDGSVVIRCAYGCLGQFEDKSEAIRRWNQRV